MMSRLCRLVSLMMLLSSPAFADDIGPLVDVGWVKANQSRDDLVLLDIRNKIDGGDATTFAEGHIPGSVYSNYLEDGWRIKRNGVVGQTPPIAQLEKLIGSLGIDNDTTVVVIPAGVSSTDFGSAARIYWTFNYVGHDKVAILDGGYRAWMANPANPIETGVHKAPDPLVFKASPRAELLVDSAVIEASLDDPSVILLDGRPEDQFRGKAKHDAADAAGHIPGALSFDQAETFDEKAGKLFDAAKLKTLIPEGLLDADTEVLSYCNTGHWASVNWFVMSELLGRQNVRLYDGSMVDWTKDPSRPLAN